MPPGNEKSTDENIPRLHTALNSASILDQTTNSLNESSSALFESTRDIFKDGKGYKKDLLRHTTKEVTVEDFNIMRVIGRGSFGKVYLVQKRGCEQVFAMKTLKKDMILRKNQAEHTKGKALNLDHKSPFS